MFLKKFSTGSFNPYPHSMGGQPNFSFEIINRITQTYLPILVFSVNPFYKILPTIYLQASNYSTVYCTVQCTLGWNDFVYVGTVNGWDNCKIKSKQNWNSLRANKRWLFNLLRSKLKNFVFRIILFCFVLDSLYFTKIKTQFIMTVVYKFTKCQENFFLKVTFPFFESHAFHDCFDKICKRCGTAGGQKTSKHRNQVGCCCNTVGQGGVIFERKKFTHVLTLLQGRMYTLIFENKKNVEYFAFDQGLEFALSLFLFFALHSFAFSLFVFWL